MKPSSISRLNHWYWSRVGNHVAVADESLGVFRWVLGSYLLLFGVVQFAWIDSAPRAFFDPPVLSLGFLLNGFPPAPFFMMLDLLTLVSLVLVTVGWLTRVSTAALLVCLVIGTTFHHSFGKIDHGSLLLILLLPCMIIADWGRYYSIDQHLGLPSLGGHRSSERRTRRGLALFATFIAFGFLTAGLPKARGWVDFDLSTSGVMQWLVPSQASLDRQGLLAGLVPGLPPLVLEGIDYLAVLMEFSGFVMLLVGRRAWRLFLLALSLFHLSNALFFNILFSTQPLLYLIFVDFTRIRHGAPSILLTRLAFGGVGVVAAYRFASIVGDFSSRVLFVPQDRADAVALWQAIGTCVLVSALLVGSIRRDAVFAEPRVSQSNDGVIAAGVVRGEDSTEG